MTRILTNFVGLEALEEWNPCGVFGSTLEDSYSSNEVVRCIHIALLCVEEDPADKPTMALIVLMLNSLSIALPSPHTRIEPKKAFKEQELDQLSSKSMSSYVNEVTITDLDSR
jgi:hypothetical protein